MTLDILAKYPNRKFSFTLVRSLSFRPALQCAAVGACAYLAWASGHLFLLPLTLVFPLALGMAESKSEVLAYSLVYFGVVWWPCVHGAQKFFSHANAAGGVCIWALAVVLSALPFAAVAWFVRKRWWPWLFAVVFVLQAVSPIGLGSPLIVAGVLFPGQRWEGFGTMCLCVIALVIWASRWKEMPRDARLWLVCSALWASVCMPLGRTVATTGWSGINTSYSIQQQHALNADWHRLGDMFVTAERATNDTVVVFPESSIAAWHPGVESAFLYGYWDLLKKEGKTVVFGATVPSRNGSDNVMLIRGAATGEYIQRFPIPLAMWGNGYRAHLSGPGVVQVGAHRAAVLLCYEQLIVWPVIESLAEHPDVIVAASNLNWARDSSIAKSEDVCVRAWARLWGIPYVEAVNR